MMSESHVITHGFQVRRARDPGGQVIGAGSGGQASQSGRGLGMGVTHGEVRLGGRFTVFGGIIYGGIRGWNRDIMEIIGVK